MKHFRIYSAPVLSLLAMLMIASHVSAQDHPFTTIDFPEATSTLAWGINPRGEIVGLYIAADTAHHGFLLSGNHLTSIEYPGATTTDVFGINSRGDVVGTYNTSANTVTHGFVLSGGRYVTIDFPGATYTGPAGINAHGDVQGLYTLAGVNHGFLLKGSDFTSFDYPGSASSGFNGFNERGDLVGNYSIAGVTHAFLYKDGSFTSIDYPNAAFTGAYGINQAGDIVGRYRDAAGVTHAFLLSGGKFTSFDYPGATFTGAAAISPEGDIVGRYTLASVNHAFLLRQAQQKRYRVTDLGTLGGKSSIAYGMNNAGWVGGGANTAAENQHAFLWKDGKMTDLGTLGGLNSVATNPNGANEVSVISETSKADPMGEDFCGYGTHRNCVAAIWKDGKLTALPTLGGNNSIGFPINNRGQIAGTAEKSTQDATCAPPQKLRFSPVLWGPNGSVRELPTLPGDTVGFALSVNDKGDAVGATGTCADSTTNANGLIFAPHAVIWQNGVPSSLGTLGGGFALAASINSRGEVVGGSALSSGENIHGFVWTLQRGMRDIGTVGDDASSFPTVINDTGQITGGSCDEEMNCRAFLWERNAMTDLNELIAGNSPLHLLFGGWINDAGEIAGQAVDTKTGELHAFVATPANGVSDTPSAAKKVTVPESIRQMLRQRWNSRHAAR